ncbi:hypothetical protein FRB98_000616, partial [Tulasnella sp. 332]
MWLRTSFSFIYAAENGVVFRALKPGDTLDPVAESVSPALDEYLELFLVVKSLRHPLCIVATGYESNHQQLDAGEIILK